MPNADDYKTKLEQLFNDFEDKVKAESHAVIAGVRVHIDELLAEHKKDTAPTPEPQVPAPAPTDEAVTLVPKKTEESS